jgi:hypothetical protein
MKIKVPDNNDLEQIHLMESNLDNLLKHKKLGGLKELKLTGFNKGTGILDFSPIKPLKEKGKIKSTLSSISKASK